MEWVVLIVEVQGERAGPDGHEERVVYVRRHDRVGYGKEKRQSYSCCSPRAAHPSPEVCVPVLRSSVPPCLARPPSPRPETACQTLPEPRPVYGEDRAGGSQLEVSAHHSAGSGEGRACVRRGAEGLRDPSEGQRGKRRVCLHLRDERFRRAEMAIGGSELDDAAVVVLEIGKQNGALRVGDRVDEENEGIAEEKRELCAEDALPRVAQRALGVGGDAG